MGSWIMVSDLYTGNPEKGTQPLAHSQHNTSVMKKVPILCYTGPVMSLSGVYQGGKVKPTSDSEHNRSMCQCHSVISNLQ